VCLCCEGECKSNSERGKGSGEREDDGEREDGEVREDVKREKK
jgi:hypothetical protein